VLLSQCPKLPVLAQNQSRKPLLKLKMALGKKEFNQLGLSNVKLT
jgi:hypothetical protein